MIRNLNQVFPNFVFPKFSWPGTWDNFDYLEVLRMTAFAYPTVAKSAYMFTTVSLTTYNEMEPPE